MLNTIEMSRGEKVRGCAVTYRAGSGSMFGTCPASCELNPSPSGADKINRDYESAVLESVPRRGVAWVYSHFKPSLWSKKTRKPKKNQTIFNYSADNIRQASRWVGKVPVVMAVNSDFWKNKPSNKKVYLGQNSKGVDLLGVRCPNELNKKLSCRDCGSGVPLCARPDRHYIVLFTGHGNQKSLVGSNKRGGCYAGGGNVALHWRKLAQEKKQAKSDSAAVRFFARSLAPRSYLRHHIAGDIGG